MMPTTHIRIITAILPFLFLGACTKNGTPIEKPAYTNLILRAFSEEPFQLRVTDNDSLLTESLSSPGSSSSMTIRYRDPLHRFRVYNVYGDVLLLDTLISYKPGYMNSFTFFQSVAGGKFTWIGPPVQEPLPDPGYIKLSVIYNFASLPELVKVVVENTISGGPDYAPTDSFTLKKGEFSRYFSGRNNNRKPTLKFYPATGPRQLLATAYSLNYDANPDFSVYLFNSSNGGNAATGYSLSATKLY